MKKFFCLNCDFVWNDLDYDCCPKCKGHEILDDGETDDEFDMDGHYEGGFKSQPYDFDEVGE